MILKMNIPCRSSCAIVSRLRLETALEKSVVLARSHIFKPEVITVAMPEAMMANIVMATNISIRVNPVRKNTFSNGVNAFFLLRFFSVPGICYEQFLSLFIIFLPAKLQRYLVQSFFLSRAFRERF